MVKRLGPKLLADHLGLLPPPPKQDTERKPRRRWSSESAILKEILTVIDDNDFLSKTGDRRMPTDLELRKLNRYDLIYQIGKMGRNKIGDALDLPPNSLGRRPKR